MTDYFKASECMIRLVQRCRCMLTIANGPPVGLTKLTSEVPVTKGSDSGRSQHGSVPWLSWKVLVGKRSAKDVAVAAMVPAWKAPDFAAAVSVIGSGSLPGCDCCFQPIGPSKHPRQISRDTST